MEEVKGFILIQNVSSLGLGELTKIRLFIDEVGAIVFDIGAHSVRAGYAGEDCPKVISVLFLISGL